MTCLGWTTPEILCQILHWSTLNRFFSFILMTATVSDYKAGSSSEQREQEQLAESITVWRTALIQHAA